MRPLILKEECSESPQDVSDARFKDLTKVAPDEEATHGIFDSSTAIRVAWSRLLVIPDDAPELVDGAAPERIDGEVNDVIADVELLDVKSYWFPEFTLILSLGSMIRSLEIETSGSLFSI